MPDTMRCEELRETPFPPEPAVKRIVEAIRMIEITTSNSTSVKPARFRVVWGLEVGVIIEC